MLDFPKWKIAIIFFISCFGILFALPNLFSDEFLEEVPDWLPTKKINLGLDLQGGSHLLLDVNINSVFSERLESVEDMVRNSLRKDRIGYKGLNTKKSSVSFRLRKPEIASEVVGLLQKANANLLINCEEGKCEASFTDQAKEEIRVSVLEQSVEIIRRRIDELGTREPTIQRQGVNRILVQLPGVKNPERIKELLGKTAKLTFHLLDPATRLDADKRHIPAGAMLLPSADPSDAEKEYVVRKKVMVGGSHLENAQASMDSGTSQWVVSFKFDSIGARKFGKVTADNVNKRLAVVLDGKVITAPVVRQAILGGVGQIQGRFNAQSANDLAILLRAGALPAPITILEERTVGPSLGQDSIDSGKAACIIALAAVIVFMLIVYGLFGFIANFALLINLALIFGFLSLLQATLTLPGIAGIVLTVGMAVDANVLVFERIREETRSGRTPINAMDSGYRNALTTIVDANVTTLIAALLLFEFGSGPIKGFAVTLSIGIITSMFTAILLTRFMMTSWLFRRKPSNLPV